MPLAHQINGDLDNQSAIETILERFTGDVHKAQELRAWLENLVDLQQAWAEEQDGYGYTVEDVLWPDPQGAPHFCAPVCEGGCADVHRRTRATCAVTLPGGASLVT